MQNRPPVLGTATFYGWRGIKALAMFCGMGPHGDSSLQLIVNSLQLIVYCLRLISWLFDDKLQISCDFLGGFEEYV